MKNISLLVFVFLCNLGLLAQDTRVLVENGKSLNGNRTCVLIKWYSSDLLYPEGLIIYRRPAGAIEWSKLNDRPITKKQAPSGEALLADASLGPFVDVVNAARGRDLQQDMMLMNLLIKSFQSNAFADFLGIYFEDHTAQEGVSYEYRVNQLRDGRESLIGISRPIVAGDLTPLAPPDSIHIQQNKKEVHFNWKHDIERYYAVNIYRRVATDTVMTKLNKDPIMLSKVADSLGNVTYPRPMFSESRQLEEGKKYVYHLSGVGFFGRETGLSPALEVSFADHTPPPPPTNLQGRADSMNVRLHWQNTSAPDLNSVVVYRSRTSAGPYSKIKTYEVLAATGSHADSLSVPGPYYYFVAAVDRAGNEAHSNLIFVDVQDVLPPAEPQGLTIRTDTGKVFLNWKMGAEPDLAGYHIYRTIDADKPANYVLLNARPVRADRFEEVLPRNVKNTFYYFIVAADTSFNKSRPSAKVSGSLPDVVPPERPVIKNASVDNEHIVVEWIPNAEPDLSGYHIYRADSLKVFEQVNVNLLAATAFRYTDRDSPVNTPLYYHLVAVDKSGNPSARSKEVDVIRKHRDAIDPGAISLRASYKKRLGQVTLSWVFASGIDITGFVVYAGPAADHLKPISGLLQAKKFVDKRGTKEETYYQVRAFSERHVVKSNSVKK